jgi:phage-related protein
MRTPDKPLLWLQGEIRTPPFSSAARIEAGGLLRRLQRGEKLEFPHSRPMPTIAARCHELRIPDESKTWRVMYYVDNEAVVILEVFAKTTTKTPLQVIDICKARLKSYQTIMRSKE